MPYFTLLAALLALSFPAGGPQVLSRAGSHAGLAQGTIVLAFDDEIGGDRGDDEDSGSADLDDQDDGDSNDDDDDDSANGPSDSWDAPEYERGTSA